MVCFLQESARVLVSLSTKCLQSPHHAQFILVSAVRYSIYCSQDSFFLGADIYLTRRELHGTAETCWFDVTDYEGFHEGNRRNKSPMLCFLLLDASQIAMPTTKHFFSIDFFENWLSAKSKTSRFFICAWLILRLVNVVFFMVFDLNVYHMYDHVSLDFWNSTLNKSETVLVSRKNINFCKENNLDSFAARLTLVCVVLVLNSLQLLFDLGDFIHKMYFYRTSWHRWTEKGKKKLAVQVVFYRIMQFLAEFSMCIGALTALSPVVESMLVSNLIYILVCFGVTWSFMYFLQLAPWIGKMVVTVQRMINDLCKYALLYAIFLFSFAHTFMRLVNLSDNRTGKCSKDFASIPDAWYR